MLANVESSPQAEGDLECLNNTRREQRIGNAKPIGGYQQHRTVDEPAAWGDSDEAVRADSGKTAQIRREANRAACPDK